MTRTAILLCSMGGPATQKDVRPFLFNLFNDKAIIRLPWLPRFLLACLISRLREKKAKEIYKKMGGGSPILEHTRQQAKALEEELQEKGAYRCFVGMSYSAPFLADVFQEIINYELEQLVVLPLYPQFSTTTTGSVERDVQKNVKRLGFKGSMKTIRSFYDNDGFLSAFAEHFHNASKNSESGTKPFVLFTAHGLPLSIVRSGDPYPDQCEKTAELLAALLGLGRDQWSLCYQSRVGAGQWTGPATDHLILEKSKQGRALILVPIAFVCEHAETRVELDQEYRQLARANGCPSFCVVQTVSSNPLFIKGLARLIDSYQ